MNAKEVGEKILEVKVETPITKEFDMNYGQKDKRWWDSIASSEDKKSAQQYHIAGRFLCGYYCGGPKDCKICNSSHSQCADCYKTDYKDARKGVDLEAPELIYKDGIRVPEAFIWIYEAFRLKTDDELKTLCKKYQHKRKILEEDRVEWERVEKRIKEMVTNA